MRKTKVLDVRIGVGGLLLAAVALGLAGTQLNLFPTGPHAAQPTTVYRVQTNTAQTAQIYSAPSGTNNQTYSFAELAGQQQDVIALQQEHARAAEVTVLAPVYKMLSDDTEGLQHERFLLILTNGTTILVAHDLSYAPRVPIYAGQVVRIHGEYKWNPRGGLIHWTHHTDTPYHDGGWIDYAGRRYQ